METIASRLRKVTADVVDKVEELETEIGQLRSENEELEDENNSFKECYIDPDNCIEIITGLGTVRFHNQSGNLWLEQELEDFAQLLK